jgi:hypothetical protein
MRTRVMTTLVIGLAVIAALLARALLETPQMVIASNSVTVTGELAHFPARAVVCQAGEILPASTTALRMSLIAYVGPAVSVTVSHDDHVIARGHQEAGWVSGSLTLQLHPQIARATSVDICLTRDPVAIPLGLFGSSSIRRLAARVNGQPLSGRMRIEYLKRGPRSWLSLARHVVRRMGLGHFPSGGWIVIPFTAIMIANLGLGLWLLRREA